MKAHKIYRWEYTDVFFDENNNEVCIFGDRKYKNYVYSYTVGQIEIWELKDKRSEDERIANFFANIAKVGATLFFGLGGFLFYLRPDNLFEKYLGVGLILFVFALWPLDWHFYKVWKSKGYTWENDKRYRNNMYGQQYCGMMLCVAVTMLTLLHFGIIK